MCQKIEKGYKGGWGENCLEVNQELTPWSHAWSSQQDNK